MTEARHRPRWNQRSAGTRPRASGKAHDAADLRGRPPSRFRFRSLSPIFDDDAVALHGEEMEGGGLEGWTARDGGPVATVGEAEWD